MNNNKWIIVQKKTLQELLKDIEKTPNVVQATNKPGLLDKLEELMSALNLCEKALNDYLETKRLAYPRFYFVSSADLLGKFIYILVGKWKWISKTVFFSLLVTYLPLNCVSNPCLTDL